MNTDGLNTPENNASKGFFSGLPRWEDRPESKTMTHEEYLNQLARVQKYEEEQKLKEEEKKTHEPFVKLKIGGLEALRKAKIDGSARIILDLFMEYMGKDNTLVISQQTIADILEYSLATVKRGIKDLIDKKVIKTIKSGNAIVYCINANIVWSTWANKEKYAHFEAKVLVSEKEQKKEEQEILEEKKPRGRVKKSKVPHVDLLVTKKDEEKES
jgi:DNA-binding Lrp family transcriptional regulator